MFGGYVPTDDGYWVSEKFQHLAEIINDYDQNFQLVWIPPDQRTTPEDEARAFAIVDSHQDYKRYVVRYIGLDDDPSLVLADLFEYDNRRHSPNEILNKIDLHNQAAELLKLKKQKDEQEVQMDMIKFLAGTRKNYINMGNGVKLDSNFRRI